MSLVSDIAPPRASARSASTTAVADADLGVVVTRQFSLWPFGTHAVRLCLLLDPSDRAAPQIPGVLRSMQQEYFRSEARSQTNAVRSAVMAAHYALRHHNHAALPHHRLTGSAACAVTRGSNVYVALAGQSAAFAWSGGALSSQRAAGRYPRPLGAEPQQPSVTLWSAPLGPGDRLVLACGAAWKDNTLLLVEEILRTRSLTEARSELATVLSGPHGPAIVLVTEGVAAARTHRFFHRDPAPVLAARGPAAAVVVREGRPPPSSARPRSSLRRPAILGAGLILAASVTAGAMMAHHSADPLAAANASLAKAQAASTTADRLRFATDAASDAQHAGSSEAPDATAVISQAESLIDQSDGSLPVAPDLRVQVAAGSSTALTDVAVSRHALFALDTASGIIRSFNLTGSNQPWEQGSVVLQSGPAAAPAGTPARPVAMTLLSSDGVLGVIDQSRNFLVVSPDGSVDVRQIADAAAWQSVSDIAAASGMLAVLDAAANHLELYPLAPPPDALQPQRAITGGQGGAPSLRSGEEVALNQDAIVREQDGQLLHVDGSGQIQALPVAIPKEDPAQAAAIVSDQNGGTFVAVPTADRIVEIGADGHVEGQLRPDTPGGFSHIHLLQTDPTGHRVYFVDDTGISSVDLPAAPAGQS